MRLAAFTVCDSYPARGSDAGRRLVGFLHLAEVAEQAGLHGVWVGEHHFRAGGACPSPAVLLAAASQRTQRLRLGVLVSVLPLHRSVTVAEEYAMVDVLSRGRLNLGVGSGFVPEELRGHGVAPEEKRARFEAGLVELICALEGRPAAASGGSVLDLPINILPVQRPHPPIWIAARRREAVEALARSARSVALLPYATVRTRRELFELLAGFHRAVPPGSKAEVAVAVHLYVGPAPARAREALDRYLATRLNPDPNGRPVIPGAAGRLPSAEEIEHEGFASFGAVEAVVDNLRELEEAGVDEVLGMFDFGDLSPAEAENSIRSVTRAWKLREERGSAVRAETSCPAITA